MGIPSERDRSGAALLELYDRSLPHVYGYLRRRCGSKEVAEDLTTETFLAALDAFRRGASAPGGTPWVIGIARHKLLDHWRRQSRAGRDLAAVAAEETVTGDEDPWDARLDALAAQAVLQVLSAHHRAALTLRYLDDLSVPEVAAVLGRSVHATEGLLVRARRAFRRAYDGEEGHRG